MLKMLTFYSPSERTTPIRKRLWFLDFLKLWRKATAPFSVDVLALLPSGVARPLSKRLAPIERHDLVHAAHAELFPICLCNVVRRHFRGVQLNIVALGAFGVRRHR